MRHVYVVLMRMSVCVCVCVSVCVVCVCMYAATGQEGCRNRALWEPLHAVEEIRALRELHPMQCQMSAQFNTPCRSRRFGLCTCASRVVVLVCVWFGLLACQFVRLLVFGTCVGV